METFNLQLMLEEKNKILIDFFKNEFLLLKEDIFNDIKKELSKLILYNEEKKENIKICGFGRTRKRGSCKRITRHILCPYHLEKFKKEYRNLSMPDGFSSGNPSGNQYISNNYSVKIENINEDLLTVNKNKNNMFIKLDLFENKICKEEITKIKIYDYCDSNLPILKYYHEKNKIYDLINGNIYYIPYTTKLNNIIIKGKYDSQGIKKLICYNPENVKKKKKKNNERKKEKTVEKLYDIFNNKIKAYINYSHFTKSEKNHIKKIINDNLNMNKNIYKNDVNYYIYDSCVMIHREIDKYFEKYIYHDIDICNKLMRNVFIYYKIFALLVDDDETEEEKKKWRTKVEYFVMNTLKDF